MIIVKRSYDKEDNMKLVGVMYYNDDAHGFTEYMKFLERAQLHGYKMHTPTDIENMMYLLHDERKISFHFQSLSYEEAKEDCKEMEEYGIKVNVSHPLMFLD